MISYPFGVGRTLTRVIEAGTGAANVVLVHGLGARADRWVGVLAVLAKAGYHGYALDLPGHGFADKGADFPYGVPGYADFIGRFIDTLDGQPVILIGTSLGGHIMAHLACRRHERVRALVLAGTTGIFPVGADVRQAISAAARDNSRAGAEAKLRRVLYDETLVSEAFIEEEYRINSSPGATEAFARLSEYFLNSVDDDAVGSDLAKLASALPILMIWGAEDESVPLAIGERAAELLGGPPFVRIGKAAHAPFYEQPAAFGRAVVTFLEGVA